MAKEQSTPSFLSKWLLPALLPVGYLLLMLFYFAAPISSGKVIYQHDIIQNRGMSKEMQDYREKTGKEALWTDAMFGGMPTYQIALRYPNNLFTTVEKIITLGLPSPYKQIWLCFLGFFALLLICGVRPWLSFAGGIGYGFSSYFFIILQAGHNTKAMAAALIPLIVAGVIWAYRGKIWAGCALVVFALALQINANHLQVTYYMGIILLGIAVAALLEAVLNRPNQQFFNGITTQRFGIASAGLIIAAGLAFLPNVGRMWTTYEYTDATMRGKSELSTDENKKGGLDKEYALRWSYGVVETFNLMVPNLLGGGTGGSEKMTPETYQLIKSAKGKAQADEMIKGVPAYWGDQPFTSGPTYIGASLIFLFVFSLALGFVSSGKVWGYGTIFASSILGVTLLAIMLSWGRNFPILTNVFFDYVPLYNKFRAVAMILMIAQFAIPFLGVLGLNEMLNNEDDQEKITKALKIAGGVCGGILILLFLMGQTWTFMGAEEKTGDALTDALMKDRVSMFNFDIIRSLFFVGSLFALCWFWVKKSVSTTLLSILVPFLILLDLFFVNKRYLNESDYVTKSKYQAELSATSPADDFILKDKSHFRVLNLASNTFNDALTSYHHKSVGGYHPAKLRRYQDMIERSIQPEVQALIGSLNKATSDSALRGAFQKAHVLNMLNTKYIIGKEDQRPLQNPTALGNAWFVKSIKSVATADEELNSLATNDPATTAIIGKDFADQVSGFTPSADSSANIQLTSYTPMEISYQSNNSKEGLAVFSEVYYAKGWKVKIDGKDSPYLRANWVLRALRIPAGKHEIKFSFEPDAYYKGEQYSLIGSLIALALIFGLFFWQWKTDNKK